MCLRGQVGGTKYLPPISIYRGAQTLTSLMSPTLTLKTFDPISVICLTIILIVALTPGIMLISITMPYTSWLLRVTGCDSLWPLHCHSHLHNLLSQTHNAVFPLQLNKSHLDCLPASVLLVLLSLMGCCHKLRIHYPHIIIQVVHGIIQLLVKPMKEVIP